MRFYFILQYRMLNRQMTDFGIIPALGYVFVLAAFIGFSLLLFNRIASAEYIYIITGLSLLVRLGETKRNQFLKTCFRDHGYYKARIIENGLIVLPFAVFLASKEMYIHALIIVFIAALFALFTFAGRSGFTIPTPFGKKPFEFTVGFRNSFLAVVLAYFMVIMAVYAGNFNLGIAALILVFLTCITFYLNPEKEFYVWIYNQGPGKFILGKITIAWLYSTFLSLPIAIGLSAFFPDRFLIIAGFLALGYIYLSTIILAKYSSFPHQINLPHFIILAVSVWFPPLLLAVIPFFYRQSVKRLKPILA
jgi:hypothetical protein